LEHLTALTATHYETCLQYRRILDSQDLQKPFVFESLEEVPVLPVRLFKEFELSSVPQKEVIKVLTSSGTTGLAPSRIFLDARTSRLQSHALVKILQEILGPRRLPMLILDHPSVVKDRRTFSARGAGIVGLAIFGRDHRYALDDEMRLDWQGVQQFMQCHAGQRVLLFGFTYMVWKYFVSELLRGGRNVPFENGVLIHSGGWKKLQAEAVDRDTFKHGIKAVTGIQQVYDFYGMVEQTGSIFLECTQGYLHAPAFGDVLFRDMRTWETLPAGEYGVIEVLSALPWSYPGHCLLTEDVGRLLGEDDCACGRLGRYFEVTGRVPRAEARGCSDTHVVRDAG
jgi:hypothetical protein